jgi:uncharacterized membrane protein
MKGKKDGLLLLTAMVVFLFTLWPAVYSVPVARGDETAKKELPARAIEVAPDYNGVVVAKGEDVSIDLTVANKGRSDEYVDLSVPEIPKGWKARIKTYSYAVTGVFVRSDSNKSLTLKAEPDKGTGPGKYAFTIRGQTPDGKLVSISHVMIVVKPKEEAKTSEGVNITTSYPVLQ